MQPPSRPLERSHGISHLFAEDKYAGLAGEADFLHLAILTDQQGVIDGLGAAVFPATFGFGNNFLALLHGGLVAIDLQTVLTGLQLGFAKLAGVQNVDGLRERLREGWNSQCDRSQQSDTAEK